MKNTNLSLVLLKQKEKVKGTQEKRKENFEFFSLRQVSTKEEIKRISAKTKKMDEKSGKPSGC
jgi:hypothetical protein